VHRRRNSVNDNFVEAPEMEGARRAQTFPSEPSERSETLQTTMSDSEQRTSSGWIGEIVDGISTAVH
jgi:hypothetical protein